MSKLRLILFLLTVNSIAVFSQTSAEDTSNVNRKDAIRLYIDCDYCDIDFIKQNISLVNYVRDRKSADVHLLITDMTTGSGGDEYTLQFIGKGKYKTLTDTLKFSLPPNTAKDELRNTQLKYIKKGLTPFILKTSLADKIMIDFEQKETKKQELVEDKWHSWVFEASMSGYSNGDDVYTNHNLWSSINISKVTPDIKIEISFNNNYAESEYRLSFDTLKTYRNSNYGNILIAKSIGEHWAAGGFLNMQGSSYSNIKIMAGAAPAIEYNLFKYSEATTKQLRFLYRVGYKYNDYIDTTIYNKTEEHLMYHHLSINFSYVQQWGNIGFSLYGYQYFNDYTKYNLGIYLYNRINLFKGFSLYINGGYSQQRDQLSLRKTASSTEEILLRQKEVATNYSYWVNFGFSYTFGSIYNNVVNPRFN